MKLVTAVLSALSSSVCLALIWGLVEGRLTATCAAFALGAGTLIGAAALRPNPEAALADPGKRAIGAWDWCAITLFTLFSLRAFLWLIFRAHDEIRVLSPNNLGDMSLHITYIRELAGGARFWPENPIYAGAALTYPLGMDLFNSLLSLLGVDLIQGLIWVGLLGCLLTGLTLWQSGRSFLILGFLGNGGFFAWQFFHDGVLADFQSEQAWKSIPLAIFVTQRGMLFAIPAGLALMHSWRARFFEKSPGSLPLWCEVLLYGSMPIFHFHTFLFLSFVLGFWVLICPAQRRALATLIGAAVLPATALVWLVTGHFHGTSMLGWQPGWMQGTDNFFVFWGMNFGVLPLFVAALCVQLFRQKRAPWAAAITVPALCVFLICCFVRFAPWAWDNTKLMIWAYLAVLPPLWSELIVHWPRPVRALSCVLLFFSGVLSMLGGIDNTKHGHPIAQRSELDAVQVATQTISFKERFAAAPTYNHPLLLNGRQLVMGYNGHVHSHGYDWFSRNEALTTLMNGAPGWTQIAATLNVRYIFWGHAENEAFPNSTQPWTESAVRVAQGPWGEIYDLSQAKDN